MALLDAFRTQQRPWSSSDEMPPELRELLDKIVKRVDQEMEPLHKQYRERWDDLNGLYFNFDRLRAKWRSAKDKDTSAARGVLLDARRDWGGHLVIPYAYATVETVVPRVVANRPKFLAKALEAVADGKLKPIQAAVNQQLSDIDLELKLNPIVRRACKLGIGVQFTYWTEEARKVVRWETNRRGQQVPVETQVVDRRGPMVEDVDVYDWLWAPEAKSIESCSDCLYRTWRPMSYIAKKVESGDWFPLDLEAIKGMANGSDRNKLWAGRLDAQNLNAPTTNSQENQLHEVWHYFTRQEVTTILDRKLVVQHDSSPFFHRELPFQVHRPTPIEGQLPGMGVIDAITDLIAEMSTMRTQRRDAATYRLNPPTFYARGMIEKRHMKTGPGVWIPVTGDIREAVFQPTMSDLPASSYAEEDRMRQDIEMTSGVSDPLAGGSGGNTQGAATATGIQLIQSAANVRIAQMARLLLLETMKPFGRQILELNRQHQIEPTEIRVEDEENPNGYRFESLTPEDWALPFEIVPEEHSNEPENRPQRIDEATRLAELSQNDPNINPQARWRYILEAWGITDIESWMKTQVQLDPQMAQTVGESMKGTLVGAGIDPQAAEQIALQAMSSAMGQTGVTPAPGQPPTNGASPQPQPQGANQ